MVCYISKKKTFSDRLLVTTRCLSSNLASQPPQMAVYSDCIWVSLLVMFGCDTKQNTWLDSENWNGRNNKVSLCLIWGSASHRVASSLQNHHRDVSNGIFCPDQDHEDGGGGGKVETPQRRLLFPQRNQKNLKINRPPWRSSNWASLFPSRCSFSFFIFVRVETAARRRPNPDAGQTATDQFHDTFIAFRFSQGDWRRPFEWTRRQLVSSELARSIAEPLSNVVVKVVVFFLTVFGRSSETLTMILPVNGWWSQSFLYQINS